MSLWERPLSDIMHYTCPTFLVINSTFKLVHTLGVDESTVLHHTLLPGRCHRKVGRVKAAAPKSTGSLEFSVLHVLGTPLHFALWIHQGTVTINQLLMLWSSSSRSVQHVCVGELPSHFLRVLNMKELGRVDADSGTIS